MISWKEMLKGNDEKDIPQEHIENMKDLLIKINKIREAYNKPMSPTSVYRTKAKQIEVYKTKGITDINKIPMSSMHLSGRALDIADPNGELWKWTKDNVALLEEIGLWVEDDPSTPRVHYQTKPPNSGNRFFKP